MDFSDLVKKLDEDLILSKSKLDNNILYLYCVKDIYEATCPYCHMTSSKVHSTYTRTIKDLPVQEYETRIVLTVHKYFCENTECKHKTFSERFKFVDDKAVRTNRLTDYVSKVGMRNSSMDTMRDLKDNYINMSVWTVLRILKKN